MKLKGGGNGFVVVEGGGGGGGVGCVVVESGCENKRSNLNCKFSP